MKERYWHLGLIGIGAIIVLVLLMRSRRSSSATATLDGNADAPGAGGNYPAPATDPLPPAVFEVGGSPLSLIYNTLPASDLLPSVQVGDGGSACPCNDDPCAAAQTLVTVPRIPQPTYQAALGNFQSYQAKVVSGGPPAAPGEAQL